MPEPLRYKRQALHRIDQVILWNNSRYYNVSLAFKVPIPPRTRTLTPDRARSVGSR